MITIDTKKIKSKKSLSQEVYEELRKRIYTNQIKPGDLIKENDFSEEFGISRTPVREALRMLVSEDLIEIKDGIGAYVKMLSIKDIKDIFEVRKALEVIAVKTGINRITESDISQLEEEFIIIKTKYELGKLENDEFIDLDMKLHELIFKRCENNFARGLYAEISLKIKQYQYMSYESLHDSEESILQHLEILKLLRDKKLDEVIVTLEKHIDWSLKCLFM